jgi:hypothetical protein
VSSAATISAFSSNLQPSTNEFISLPKGLIPQPPFCDSVGGLAFQEAVGSEALDVSAEYTSWPLMATKPEIVGGDDAEDEARFDVGRFDHRRSVMLTVFEGQC